MSAGKSRTREQRGGGDEREGENSDAPCWIASSAALAFSASSWSCASKFALDSARLRKALGPTSTGAEWQRQSKRTFARAFSSYSFWSHVFCAA